MTLIYNPVPVFGFNFKNGGNDTRLQDNVAREVKFLISLVAPAI